MLLFVIVKKPKGLPCHGFLMVSETECPEISITLENNISKVQSLKYVTQATNIMDSRKRAELTTASASSPKGTSLWNC